jgi:hypothetical protein
MAGPAAAWSNGSDGYNSFGTHDWILAKALKGAGDPSWVDRSVALRATDDPDSKDGIPYASGTWWHVWDRWGDTYGGAPEAAAHWFRVIQKRRAAGNDRGASRALGIFAHIVGDIGNPTHTDSTEREESMHSAHESGTDDRLSSYRFSFDGERERRPAAAVKAMAKKGHRLYFELVKQYSRHGYNQRVTEITQVSLRRAANVLADLILSL